jgi:hypothetical protein
MFIIYSGPIICSKDTVMLYGIKHKTFLKIKHQNWMIFANIFTANFDTKLHVAICIILLFVAIKLKVKETFRTTAILLL